MEREDLSNRWILDLFEEVQTVSHPLVQQVIDLGRACGVKFFTFPRGFGAEGEMKALFDASPCPLNSSDPLTVSLFCCMADVEKGTAGLVFFPLDLTIEEWEESWEPYAESKALLHGAIVLLHEVAHAVVGEEEELTVPWEQVACHELFRDSGTSMFDNLLHYEDGAGMPDGIFWAERQLVSCGVLSEDRCSVMRKVYQGPSWRKHLLEEEARS